MGLCELYNIFYNILFYDAGYVNKLNNIHNIFYFITLDMFTTYSTIFYFMTLGMFTTIFCKIFSNIPPSGGWVHYRLFVGFSIKNYTLITIILPII